MPSEEVETGVEEVLRPEAFSYPPLKLLVCTWRLSNRQRITAVIRRLTANCRSCMYTFACSGMGKWHTPSSLDRILQTQPRPASPSADGWIPGRKSPHISIAAKRPSGDGRKKRTYAFIACSTNRAAQFMHTPANWTPGDMDPCGQTEGSPMPIDGTYTSRLEDVKIDFCVLSDRRPKNFAPGGSCV
jgi:hypothetical protein